MRGIHLKEIDSDRRELPEYRNGSFHIPVNDTDPFLELPETLQELAREIRSELEQTLRTLERALAAAARRKGEETN